MLLLLKCFWWPESFEEWTSLMRNLFSIKLVPAFFNSWFISMSLSWSAFPEKKLQHFCSRMRSWKRLIFFRCMRKVSRVLVYTYDMQPHIINETVSFVICLIRMAPDNNSSPICFSSSQRDLVFFHVGVGAGFCLSFLCINPFSEAFL